MEKELLKALKQFTAFLKERLDTSLKTGEFEKLITRGEYFKTKVEKFNYSIEAGVSQLSTTEERFTKTRFIFGSRVLERIKQSDEYNLLLTKLSKSLKTEELEQKLESLLQVMLDRYLEKSKVDDAALLQSFLKELNGEPIKIWATVELQGITLEPESIQIANEIKLRRPTPNDFEREGPIGGRVPFSTVFVTGSSAILEIEIVARKPVEIQKQVEKAVTILRLFKVGSVKYKSYKMHSESALYSGYGTLWSGDTTPPLVFCPIYAIDVKGLQKFWKETSAMLPEEFFGFEDSVRLADLSFAYQRYSDALLRRGLLEARIANATAGLEAVYSDSSQEIGRFLALRTSKFLGLAGLNPRRIKNMLSDAYGVRSSFVHGSRLSDKVKKKLEKKYGSLNEFLNEILDCLRCSIVLVLFLGKEKKELTRCIDEAMLDHEEEAKLQRALKRITRRAGLNYNGA